MGGFPARVARDEGRRDMSKDELVNSYREGTMSRRAFVRGMVVLGVSLATAMTYAGALAKPGANPGRGRPEYPGSEYPPGQSEYPPSGTPPGSSPPGGGHGRSPSNPSGDPPGSAPPGGGHGRGGRFR